jgi:hypothetical protein
MIYHETVDDASNFAIASTYLSLSLASAGDVGEEVVNDSTSVVEYGQLKC